MILVICVILTKGSPVGRKRSLMGHNAVACQRRGQPYEQAPKGKFSIPKPNTLMSFLTTCSILSSLGVNYLCISVFIVLIQY